MNSIEPNYIAENRTTVRAGEVPDNFLEQGEVFLQLERSEWFLSEVLSVENEFLHVKIINNKFIIKLLSLLNIIKL